MFTFSSDDMKRFIKKIIAFMAVVAFLISVADCFILLRMQKNWGTMSSKRGDRATIKEVPNGINLCNFGSSHGLYGFNYISVPDEYTCFNFALPSQSLSYDFRILKNYADRLTKGAIIIIPVSHLSLFGVAEDEAASFESLNRRYYRFLDPQNIKNYDWKTAVLAKYFPVLITDSLVSLIKQMVDDNGVNYWGNETDPEAAASHGIVRYRTFVESKKDYEGNRVFNDSEISALIDMIMYAKENEWIPVLVTTPYLSEYNSAVKKRDPDFLNDFYAVIDYVIEKTDIKYFDYSEDARFSNEYTFFFNTDHLNYQGAARFTGILMEEVVPEL